MWSVVEDARDAVPGHEAVLVSHQLPIWVTRLYAERRRFLHDPRRRQCTLCSVTSFEFDGEQLVRIAYSEPAGDLIPAADRRDPFSSGGAAEQAG
jgi:broad specificity phosphatase PhoE